MKAFYVAIVAVVAYLLNEEAKVPQSSVTAESMWALISTKAGELELKQVPIPKPAPGQLLVRMHMSPVNPSDVYRALGDYSGGLVKNPTFPHPNGFEGMGQVVGHGGGFIPFVMMMNKLRVSVVVSDPATQGTWAEYFVADPMEVLPVLSGTEDKDAASAFVNPMTTVAMLEIAKSNGHKAIVHTAASSALGLMLLRAAPKYNVDIICVVRGEKNERFLLDVMNVTQDRVVRSDLNNFEDNLKAAVEKFKATLSFDAVGGPHSEKIYNSMPAKSENYVYGLLSGEPTPQALYDKAASTQGKPLSYFLLKDWLEQGGFMRLGKVIYALITMLSNELRTEYVKHLPLRDPATLQDIKEYFKHQKGGKMLLTML